MSWYPRICTRTPMPGDRAGMRNWLYFWGFHWGWLSFGKLAMRKNPDFVETAARTSAPAAPTNWEALDALRARIGALAQTADELGLDLSGIEREMWNEINPRDCE